MKFIAVACMVLAFGVADDPPRLELPARPATAPAGVAFARSIASMSLAERERAIVGQVVAGNVPAFLRSLVPVAIAEGGHQATLFVAPDYLGVGSDDDYVLMPLAPASAQAIADRLGCALPTTKIVDAIHRGAGLKLTPAPIPPSAAMTTVPVFLEHHAKVLAARLGKPPGTLVAGHKKDVVIANKVFATPGKVAIYGWHRPDGTPIQPLYTKHTSAWVDYSHGVRLVSRAMILDGRPTTIDAVLADPALAGLLSVDGVMPRTRYPAEDPRPAAPALKAGPGEGFETLRFDRGVRVVVSRPEGPPSKPVLLVFYATPNGNTIEQTIGKRPAPGDDWHVDIQHIGAQTRFLRSVMVDRCLVVAYLENDLRSWPAWRRKHGDTAIPAILDAVRERFAGQEGRIVLSGHSGGGGLVFGYLDGLAAIPEHVERIALLDANYAYATDRHRDKLARWLRAADGRHLVVLAYEDSIALLEGKPFVSAEGGTWGRSRRMIADLEALFPFVNDRAGGVDRRRALDGRVAFLLKENPERKVLHTVQVERNGFIECLLSGTNLEGVGYAYFGARAYTRWIMAD